MTTKRPKKALALPLRWVEFAEPIWGRNIAIYDANDVLILEGIHLASGAAAAIVKAVNDIPVE